MKIFRLQNCEFQGPHVVLIGNYLPKSTEKVYVGGILRSPGIIFDNRSRNPDWEQIENFSLGVSQSTSGLALEIWTLKFENQIFQLDWEKDQKILRLVTAWKNQTKNFLVDFSV